MKSSEWQDGSVTSATEVSPDALRARLASARLYLCTDARQRQGDLQKFLDAVLGAGVDIVQLRQKGLEAGEELRFLEVFRAACDRHGRCWPSTTAPTWRSPRERTCCTSARTTSRPPWPGRYSGLTR